MAENYVHGYGQRENIRLRDQASTLVELLHSDTVYPPEAEFSRRAAAWGLRP